MTQPDAQAHEDLAVLAQGRPSLKPLISKLGRGAEIRWDADFHSAYRKSSAHDKALILRALFDDTSLFRRGGEPQMTRAIARRVRTYLECLPSEPLRTGLANRDHIPKPLSRLFGLDRASWIDLSDSIVGRLWPHGRDAEGEWSKSVCEELMPIVHARLLTEGVADSLIVNGMRIAAGHYYFDVPSTDAIAVRNMAVYLGRLFAHGRNGGREQNLIPIQVAQRFGIRPRCVPETLAVMDVLALYGHGCINVSRKDDPLRIEGLFEQPAPGGFNGFWHEALQPHLARGFVSDPQETIETGQFDTGFRFNVARLVGLIEGKTQRLQDFAPYYARADRDALMRVAMRFWKRISATVARRCWALYVELDAKREIPIRLRDLGNIICVADAVPDGSNLPSVARFALGVPEPVYTGRMGPRGPSMRSEAEPAAPKPLPQLSELLSALDRIEVEVA